MEESIYKLTGLQNFWGGSNVLEEDPKLLMWYHQAETRMGGE